MPLQKRYLVFPNIIFKMLPSKLRACKVLCYRPKLTIIFVGDCANTTVPPIFFSFHAALQGDVRD